MNNENEALAVAGSYTAFSGQRQVASGELSAVVRKLKPLADQAVPPLILIFADATGAVIDVDFRGGIGEVVARLNKNPGPAVSGAAQKRSPGRPKLGVLAREITLLPGHWDWLDAQTGGASAALRRLVQEAKKGGGNSARQSQDAVYRFMTVMAGDLPGFEEALRAFYRRDMARFNELIKPWPTDIRRHVKKLIAATRPDGARARVRKAIATSKLNFDVSWNELREITREP